MKITGGVDHNNCNKMRSVAVDGAFYPTRSIAVKKSILCLSCHVEFLDRVWWRLVLALFVLDRCCQVDVKQSIQTDSDSFQVNQCAGITSSFEWQFTLQSCHRGDGAGRRLVVWNVLTLQFVYFCVCVCALMHHNESNQAD